MNFCPNCDNKFTFKEDIENRTLQYNCSVCNISNTMNDFCLSTKTLKTKKDLYINYDDAMYDKTLPTRNTQTCNKCGKNDICFIRNKDMSVIYVCKNEKCKNVIYNIIQ